MSDRTPIIAGNWKMYKTTAEAAAYMEEFKGLVADVTGVEIIVCPPYTSLGNVKELAQGSNILVAAQNMHFEPEGAFTGEVSAPMLIDIDADGVILGHSERRQYFNETDLALAKKVRVALDAGLLPIYCCGETDAEREAGSTEEKIRRQIIDGLSEVGSARLASVVVAYEPIWAIGTGKTATPQIAQDTISLVRGTLADQYGSEAAGQVRILYGGSVKPENIGELMAEEDIDGALVGGASLDAPGFARIVKYR
ncbi:MAG: triose-phosphate isomerase [Thermoleophilia bacterium]|nr:triose-phosphate isomerase [Thermoleophilia bacterium]